MVSGKGAERAFANEAGGHRWQRIPPTEKKGRVHTSTITIAVLAVPNEQEFRLDERDLDWKTCRGSGAGGQHRNVTDSAVQLMHLPTGVSVRCEAERSQLQNKVKALEVLRSRLRMRAQDEADATQQTDRKSQVGSGMRGDKVRTVALQRDQVIHHPNDKRMSAKKYLQGHLEDLWS